MELTHNCTVKNILQDVRIRDITATFYNIEIKRIYPCANIFCVYVEGATSKFPVKGYIYIQGFADLCLQPEQKVSFAITDKHRQVGIININNVLYPSSHCLIEY